jgi:hypothetical protein
MPKNEVTDTITGQEIAFAHLVLSGTMTDRCAAEIVGLHPDSAAYTKSRPPVHAYIQEHQAAAQQELGEQGADPSRLPRLAVGRAVEDHRPFNVSRDQILDRLWEIAHMNPEITRGSLAGQVKALSMIVAIEGLIPDRRAASARNQTAPPPVTADIYKAAWLRAQQTGENDGENIDPPRTASQEKTACGPSSAPGGPDGPPPTAEPTAAPASAVSQHRAAPGNGTPAPSLAPRVPMADRSAPDTRVPFTVKRNPFARRR